MQEAAQDNRIPAAGKLKSVDGKGQLSTRSAEAPKRTALVASLHYHNNSIFVDVVVDCKTCSLLLDTGATKTILRPDVGKFVKDIRPIK